MSDGKMDLADVAAFVAVGKFLRDTCYDERDVEESPFAHANKVLRGELKRIIESHSDWRGTSLNQFACGLVQPETSNRQRIMTVEELLAHLRSAQYCRGGRAIVRALAYCVSGIQY